MPHRDLACAAARLLGLVWLTVAACTFDGAGQTSESGGDGRGAPDAAHDDPGPAAPDASTSPLAPTCDELCSLGKCEGEVCVIKCEKRDDCPGAQACPAGVECRFECSGERACAGSIACGADAACTIECTGRDSCAGAIACGPERCDLDCSGRDACRGAVDCSAACACEANGRNGEGSDASCPLLCGTLDGGCTGTGLCDACE